MSYGLPAGTNVPYGSRTGFPAWVYQLADAFSVQASTYPGHQESDRGGEPGYAPNPQRLNRGIDFSSSDVNKMQALADYLFNIRSQLEQIIWQNPRTNEVIAVAGGKDVSRTNYFTADLPGHRDHVHVRTSQPIPLPNTSGGAPVGWTGDPVWLEDVLRPALGSKLKTLPDWQNYGHGDYGPIWGVMVHHTGNANADAMSIRNGRPDLEGPLSNLHIAQDGTVTIVAAGVCWHAGMGSYPGIPTNGANQVVIGIECAWPRDTSITPATQTRERWPDAEIISMRDTVAAILTKLGYNSSRVIGHKEWAGAAQGKWDPGNINMNWFRAEVGKAMRGEFKPKPPTTTPTTNYPADYTDRQLLESIWRKLDGLAATIGAPR